MASEELLHVVTPQMGFTGVVKPKSQVHRDGDWHVCVHGFVTDGTGRLLVQYRGPMVNLMRERWDFVSVAGHISASHEDSIDHNPAADGGPRAIDWLQLAIETLIREFEEEIGVVLPREEFFGFDIFFIGITRTDQQTEDGWWDRTFSFNFVIVEGVSTTGSEHIFPEELRLEPGKVLEVKWMDVGDIEAALRRERPEIFAERWPDQRRLVASVIHAVQQVRDDVRWAEEDQSD